MLGTNCIPPKYVRAIHITNSTKGQVILHVKFQSEFQETVELNQNEKKTVEKEINMGSWTAVDPISDVTVTYGNLQKELTLDPQGVEIRTYNIVEEGETFEVVRA
jgi:hypothetical protein